MPCDWYVVVSLISLFLVTGCYTNCVGWQFVRVEKTGVGSCIFRKTAMFQLMSAEKKDSMSDDRQVILSFFYQKPDQHGFVVSSMLAIPSIIRRVDRIGSHVSLSSPWCVCLYVVCIVWCVSARAPFV
jgi:hypothetical protein